MAGAPVIRVVAGMLPLVLWLGTLNALAGCPVAEPVTPEPDTLGVDDCAPSCAAWRRLRCPEASPSPEGAACEETCRNAETVGVDVAKRPECAATSISCAALRACPY